MQSHQRVTVEPAAASQGQVTLREEGRAPPMTQRRRRDDQLKRHEADEGL